MILWVIVPAKDPALAKTRLAPALDDEARQRLSLGLLDHTVRAALASSAVAQVMVVSADDGPLALAVQLGALPLREALAAPVSALGRQLAPAEVDGVRSDPARTAALADAPVEGGLNAALSQARRAALLEGADAVLVLHADLPLLTPQAIEDLVAALRGGAGAVIAPDRHRSGTNALLLRPPAALPFLFGRRSFARHVQAAWEHDLPYVVAADPAFATDLDTPEDLAWLRECVANAGGDPWLRALIAGLDAARKPPTSVPPDGRARLRCGR